MEWSGRDLGIHSQETPVSKTSLTGRSSLLRGQNKKPRQTRRAPVLRPRDFCGTSTRGAFPATRWDGTTPRAARPRIPRCFCGQPPPRSPGPAHPAAAAAPGGGCGRCWSSPWRAGRALQPLPTAGSGRVRSRRVGSGPVGSERGWRGRRAAPTYGAGGRPRRWSLKSAPAAQAGRACPGADFCAVSGCHKCEWQQAGGDCRSV